MKTTFVSFPVDETTQVHTSSRSLAVVALTCLLAIAVTSLALRGSGSVAAASADRFPARVTH